MMRSTRFWEVLALVLTVSALAPLLLPALGDLLMRGDPDEIVVRLSIRESGGYDPQTIEVKAGQMVKLVLVATDVSHGFAIDQLGLDAGVVTPETPVVIEFTAEEKGEYRFKCSVKCSPSHYSMRGTLVVK
jgi:heme/copper-type cytochrome/quinol oxidase subunit 2